MIEIKKRMIKFRSRNRELKEMNYDAIVQIAYDPDMKYSLNMIIGNIQRSCDLMLFIGAHDINGKEIYEGDIVKWKEQVGDDKSIKRNDEIIGVVLWDREGCRFVVLQLTNGKWSCQIEDLICEHNTNFYSYSGAEFNWEELEIVGNIYENPELCTNIEQ